MTLLNRLAAAALINGGLLLPPAQAYDLQYRQNGTTFSAPQLRQIFNGSLPAEYDQRFPDQRWSSCCSPRTPTKTWWRSPWA